MEEDSEFEPCRVAVYVGAIPSGLRWKIVFNLKKSKVMKQVRMVVIAVLAMVGLVLIASEPSDGVDWFAVMFWKSLAGFCCWGVCALLYKRWNSRGLLPEDEKYSDEW